MRRRSNAKPRRLVRDHRSKLIAPPMTATNTLRTAPARVNQKAIDSF